jgi:Tol biopolymer transport system component
VLLIDVQRRGWLCRVASVAVLGAVLVCVPTTYAGRNLSSSADREIAFASNRGGNFNLYTMRADGSGVRPITDDPSADVAPSWSPDGKRIVFLSQRGLSKTLVKEGGFRVFVVSAGGGQARLLTSTPAQYGRPAWAPNGRLIAVSLPNLPSFVAGMFLLSAVNGQRARVSRAGSLEDDWPTWSPDGSRMAFVAVDACCPPHEHVYVMRADGRARHPLTRGDVGRDSAPAWSPDGFRIAFSYAFRLGTGPWRAEIQAVSTDGTKLDTLSRGHLDDQPTWSPDSSRIAFVRSTGKTAHLYVIRAAGGQPRQLTRGQSIDVEPAWQPA